MNDNIVNATMSEATEKPDREHVLARLKDWQTRVHALYDSVQTPLGNDYTYDRSGKQTSNEGPVLKAGLKSEEVPKLDILRIEHHDTLVATFQPRGLWIIGANGRVDMINTARSGGRSFFILYDQSLPLSGKSDWRIVRPSSDPLYQPPFRPERFHELLQ